MVGRANGETDRMTRRRAVAAIATLVGALLLSSSMAFGQTTTSTSAATSMAKAAVAWKPCRDVPRLRCTKLTVPLDYAAPSGGTVDVAITMSPARKPKARIGVLLVNPGGPGASGTKFVRQLQRGFSSALLDRFDVVGWDPRGVGSTGQIRCLATTAAYDKFYAVDPDPDSPTEVRDLVSAAKEFAAGCASRNPAEVLRTAGTANVVRDMESIRVALREEQISFFGFSYGTLLGLRYADAFPTRVRAFALDGILSPTADTVERSVQQAAGFDRALNGFLAGCQKGGCGWVRTGESASGAFDRLARSLDLKALIVTRRGATRRLGPGEFTTGVLAALYSRESGWPVLRQALTKADDGDGSAMLNLFDAYADRERSGYGNIADANAAVNCVDVESPRGDAEFVTLADRLAATSPRFGRLAGYSSIVCGFWPVPSTGVTTPVVARGSAPILLIGTTRDPATPYVWAQSAARALDNAVLLTYDSDGHTAYLTGNLCIRRYVDRYLVDTETPPPESTCERQ
jgi:pimeloyl-ACP methyl ester carboxylesterase